MIGVWALYWAWLMPPWRYFVHADNAVPYLMTTTPWAKEDFYYWGAMRFGAPYMVLWKAVFRPLLGGGAAPFFTVFPACFFLGTAFWLAVIPGWLRRLAFLLLMLPLMPMRIDTFLMPGHVYGTVYGLCGVAVYLLLNRPRLTPRTGVVLGMITAITYWQHLLAGLGLLTFALLKYRCDAPALQAGQKSSWLRQALPFWLSLALCVVPIEVTRYFAAKWDTFLFDHLEHWQFFLAGLRDFAAKGLVFGLGRAFGLTLLAATLGALGFACSTLRRASKPGCAAPTAAAGSDGGYLRLFVLVSLLSPFVCLLMFCTHAHYRLNFFHERYFYFLVPLLLLAIVRLPEVCKRKGATRYSHAVLAVLVVLAAARQLGERTDSIFDASTLATLRDRWSADEQLLALLQSAHCSGAVASYWTAYQLAALSDGRFPASGGDHIRNPLYFAEILAKPEVCIATGLQDTALVRTTLADPRRACSRLDARFWRCAAAAP